MSDHNTVLERREVLYEDLEFFVVAESFQHRIDVVVYPVFGMLKDGVLEKQSDGRPYFVEKKMGGSPVTSLEEAEVQLSGSVKWDGCSNWSLFGDPHCMTHFCSKQEAVDIGTLLGRLYDLAAEMVPSWSGDK